jgi:hypothetical protein
LRLNFPQSQSFTERFRKHIPRDSYLQDYRRFGLPVVLRKPDPQWGRRAPLTLDFPEVGKLSAGDILSVMSKVIDDDPTNTLVGGADFTADWTGGTISKCRRCFNVRRKRHYSEVINRNEPMTAEYGEVESLYFGSRSSGDFYRIYDKSAERRARGLKTGRPCVRVERHLKRRCLPQRLRTLGGLLSHGCSYEPFNQIMIVPLGKTKPAHLLDWRAKPNERRRAVYLLTLVLADGNTIARKRLVAEHRKPAVEFALLQRALIQIGRHPVRIPNLNAIYQQNFAQQMWPGVAWKDPILITREQDGVNCLDRRESRAQRVAERSEAIKRGGPRP